MKILPFNFFFYNNHLFLHLFIIVQLLNYWYSSYLSFKKTHKNKSRHLHEHLYLHSKSPSTPQSSTNHALLPLESDGQSLFQFLQGLFDQTLTAAVKHPLCKPANKKNQGIKIKFHFQSSQFQVRYANKNLQWLNRSQGNM